MIYCSSTKNGKVCESLASERKGQPNLVFDLPNSALQESLVLATLGSPIGLLKLIAKLKVGSGPNLGQLSIRKTHAQMEP